MARPKSTGEIKSHQQHLLMTPSEVKAIDDWRFANRIGSRGDAIRRLCEIGMGVDQVGVPSAIGHLNNLVEGISKDVQWLLDILDGREEAPDNVEESILDAIELLGKISDHVKILDLNLWEQRLWIEQVKSGPDTKMEEVYEKARPSIDDVRSKIIARLEDEGEGE